MIARLLQRTSPIGIGWDGRLLTAVQLTTGGAIPRLARAVRIERTDGQDPPDGEEALRVRRVLTRRGFRGERRVGDVGHGRAGRQRPAQVTVDG